MAKLAAAARSVVACNIFFVVIRIVFHNLWLDLRQPEPKPNFRNQIVIWLGLAGTQK